MSNIAGEKIKVEVFVENQLILKNTKLEILFQKC